MLPVVAPPGCGSAYRHHRDLSVLDQINRHLGDRAPGPDRQRSDDLDGNCIRVGGERFDVGSVAGQDRPAGLSDRDNERVDS